MRQFHQLPPSADTAPKTLGELLAVRAAQCPTELAYAFLRDDLSIETQLSYAQLAQRANGLAVQIAARAAVGERVLLVYGPGLDSVVAFFACAVAGVVAVPTASPDGARLKSALPRLRLIAADAKAVLTLTTQATLAKLRELNAASADELKSWLATDTVGACLAALQDDRRREPSDTAYLQYTSGSTGTPRGVAISHANVLANCAAISAKVPHSDQPGSLSWLPYFHDYGLVQGIVWPLSRAMPGYLLSPLTFLRRPLRWLEAMSRYRVSYTGAPNFALAACVKALASQADWQAGLDAVRVISCGAEPIKAATVEAFLTSFARFGLSRNAFSPAYGLAEATLMVTGKPPETEMTTLRVSTATLAEGRVTQSTDEASARVLVSCGTPGLETQVQIVSQHNHAPLPENRVGEIWVSGPSVGRGYFGNQSASKEVFAGSLVAVPGTTYLRTGDLGFLRDGELFITGRLKDLLIFSGRNYHPQDLEWTAESSDERIRSGHGAAFSIDSADGEQLVVALEVDRRLKPDELQSVAAVARRAIAVEHELRAHIVVLVRSGTVPRTSSGKVRRQQCRAEYLADQLDILHLDRLAPDRQAAVGDTVDDVAVPSLAEIRAITSDTARHGLLAQTLRVAVAQQLERDTDAVPLDASAIELGLDSLAVAQVLRRLEVAWQVRLPPGNLLAAETLSEAARLLQLQVDAHELVDEGAGSELAPRVSPAADGLLPLSPAQERLWFLAQIEGASRAYHLGGGIRFTGILNRPALGRALDAVIARHEMLRTVFISRAGVPMQRVLAAADREFALVEHPTDAGPVEREELMGVLEAEARAPFDLVRGPLIRGLLIQESSEQAVLWLSMHHIVADGWSIGVLSREIGALYRAFAAGELNPLPPLAAQYRDYVWRQRQLLGSAKLERQLRYWRAQLTNAPINIELPIDTARQTFDDFSGSARALELDNELVAAIREFARRNQVTLYVALLSSWVALLARISGQDDLVIGTASADRPGRQFDQLIGFCVNTLALRFRLPPATSVAALLALVRSQVLAAQEHADVPFERVVDALRVDRGRAHSPLFNVMFAWQNTGSDADLLPGLVSERLTFAPVEAVPVDLTMVFETIGERLVGRIEYSTALFDTPTIDRLLQCWRRLLVAMLADTELSVAALPLVAMGESGSRLAGPVAEVADELPLHELFVQRTAQAGGSVALLQGERTVSYAELDRRSSELAGRLIALGVGREDRVALTGQRSIELVVGMLATLKAGGAFVPLDPQYPAERLAWMLSDAAPKVLLKSADQATPWAETRPQMTVLELSATAEPAASMVTLPTVRADALAYMIYTSGSSGTPKGVLVEHRNAVNLVRAMASIFELTPADRVLHQSSISFDPSIWELFVPLACGASVALAPSGAQSDPARILTAIEQSDASVVSFVPAFLQALLDHREMRLLKTVRIVVSGGESLPPQRVHDLRRRWPQARILNLYGPTECTVVSTWYDATRLPVNAASVPIGQPLAAVTAEVLDSVGQPVPPGVVGELHVSGVAVARGYWQRPELTLEHFSAAANTAAPGRRYRTGDLVRLRPDQQLEYVGRVDQQLKIRGMRTEPGEIETALLAVPGVRAACVVAQPDATGNNSLLAYLVGEIGAPTELRASLAQRLPAHMVPAAFVELAALPLLPSGKVDRHQLPAVAVSLYAQRAYSPPVGPVETQLAAVWQELLQIERVGREDNFFELGGHSLLAVALVERMAGSGLYAEPRQVFAAPTLRGLAQELRTTSTVAAVVPPNLIGAQCDAIAPDMLPLVDLSQREIDHIVATVPGGARAIQDIYPLAPLQEGIFFHHLLSGDRDPYLSTLVLQFDAKSDMQQYWRALGQVVQRHDALRTAVVHEHLRQPVQVVWRSAEPVLDEVILEADAVDPVQRLRSLATQRHPNMPLDRAPLLRGIAAANPVDKSWYLLLLSHHLTSDHSTLETINAEIAALRANPDAELPAPVPFRRLVVHALDPAARASHAAFFQAMLADIDEPTAAYGLLDVRGDGIGNVAHSERLDTQLLERLRAVSRQLQVSSASVLHLAFAALLARLAGRLDVVFGTVVLGRLSGADSAGKVVGPSINTLPLRVALRDQSVTSGLRAMYRSLTDLMGHEQASLALAQRCSSIPAPAPLFTSLLNYRHNVRGAVSAAPPGVRVCLAEERTNYPLAVVVDDDEASLGITIDANAALDARSLWRMLHHTLVQLIGALESQPELGIEQLEVLSSEEQEQALRYARGAITPAADELTLHELFEQRATQAGGSVALLQGERTVSYAELDRRATELAGRLIALGVGLEDRVALTGQRSIELVVAMLATLKAGAAYVPLDPQYPAERLAWMLSDAAPKVLLKSAAEATPWAETRPQMTVLELTADVTAEGSAASTVSLPKVRANALAYMIYTSGSSGTPKGVLVEHCNAVNLVRAMQPVLQLTSADRMLHHSSISFDASIWELFVPLASGAGVIVAAPTAQGDPAEMLRTIERDAATVMLFVPAFLQAMLDHSEMRAQPSVRLVAAGGEALLATRARQLRSQWPQAQILNLYGPTESAVVATVYDTTHLPADAVAVPIGRPIANSTAYILDDRLRPVPVGVVGEICLGGASVVRGYHNRAALSRERFSSDPFAAAANARLYRTGDLGRYLPDGNIEFLGRTDTQVKLRGFRVELGEIEAQLAAQVGMRDACVTLHRGVGGADTLVAYLVGDDINIATLREALARSLPRHMIPTAFVELDALPLLPNGKVNRQQLPEPQQNAYVRTEFSAAETATERQLAAIWCEVLQLERVGREDNFFELGGHSLLATQVASRVRVQFGLDVPLRRLFEQPSLAAFAAQIDLAQRSSERVPSRAIEPLPRDAPLPVSFSQRRMWFMQQLEPQGTAYNIPAAVRLRGPLEPGILRRAMDDLAARHEAFRTSFSIVAGEPVQIIALQHRGRIEPIDLTDLDLAAAEAEAARLCRAESLRPFDLQTGPLWRIHLIKLRADDTVLLWSMHHVISDQWSMGVLARDLAFFYNQRAHRELGTHTGNAEVESLPPLRIQYADFAVWQRQHWNDATLEVQLDFWRQRLRGLEPLELPTDNARTAMPTSRGGAVNAKLSAATLEGINRLSVQLGVTPFMTLLACFKLLLARYSGQEDIAVGVPIANRHRLETETLVGTLVNMVVMRTDLSGDASFAAIVGRVRETALEAYTHQDTSFERLVEELVDKRVSSRAPLVQVMFNVPNAPLTMPSLQGLTTEPFRFESGSAQFELSLTVDTELTQIVSLAYATDLFVAQTAERMLAGYLRLLDQVIGDPQRRITELELLSAAERAQLIAEGSRSGDDYPERRVDQLVARQAARTPDAIAVRMGEQRLTYAELQRQVDALAGQLTKRGIGRSALVGVHLERSPAMLVALLAIMRSGAAYVPLDPGFPRDRLEFMVDDAGVALVLSERSLRKSRPANWPLVELESIAHDERAAGLPAAVATLDDLAYVLYTSGSTGQPKGIEIEHRALTNFLHSMAAQPGCGQNDVLLAVTTLSFDISGLELYLPLTVGGQVVIASRAEAADGNLLRKAIAKYHPTVMQATPATWRMLLVSGWAGEPQLRVLCGGEALPADLARSLLTRCASLWNLYGPTETTIWSTTARIEKVADVVPIGIPIANTSVHVLDRNMRPVPPGVAGELYIGGEGVARGYRNRTDLTRERFISNPFAADAAARLYRTGDRARRLPSGELQHLGRLDFQVKVRGFRVELGEIETVMAQHPGLQQVVVAAKADSDGVAQRLVGYAVAAPGAAPTTQEMRAFLQGKLPDYMVPSQFMLLDKLPLTANNKVDIRALPEPVIERRPTRDAALEEPSDMLQLQLLALWRQVLNDPALGIEDNFFDAGGHSLKAVELLTLVEQVFHKQLPLAMFFEAPTVAKMALLVRASGWSPSWRSLVAIQPRGLKLPLFAVPGAGGNVLVFAALAKLLGKERPLYGLQSRGLDGLSKPFKTIEDAAEHFLTEMRSVQPAGPYFILGTCTGGVVGFEMAQRLRRAGEQVTLAIIETWHPSSNRRSVLGVDRFWRLRQWQERLRLFFTVLREVPVTRWPAFIVGKLASVLRGDPAQPDTETARSDRVRDATMQAVAHYQAVPYPGRVLNVIASQRKIDHNTSDTRREWEALATGGALFEQIPAEDSGRLFVSPHVEQLAQHVRRFAATELQAADATYAQRSESAGR